MTTRKLRHAVVIWVEDDGSAQWDHSEDGNLRGTLTPDQLDTVAMLYNGYKSAQRANQMMEEAREAAHAKRQNSVVVAHKHNVWERDAADTERLLKEVKAG